MALLRSRVRAAGGGGIADKLFPGWQDKVWAMTPPAVKAYQVKSENDAFESHINHHKTVQGYYKSWKEVEAKMAPSAKYRKPAVDWKRQLARGTLHFGRWYEGPHGSDYRPGNTFDRMENVREPFTDAEWEERKNHRSWNLVYFAYGLIGIFLAYRITTDWPVVWCDDRVPIEQKDSKEEEEA